MASVSEVMQLCRLCLVKDEVNIPIFEEQGDIRQIFLKISACLPVKVARDDNLPKRICDGCSCKLEMLYQFWHTSAQAEKKLIKWINEITYDKSANKVISTVQHSNDPMILKQEVVDVGDTHSSSDELVPEDLNASDDAQDYLMQQQQLPYQNVEYFEEDGLDEEPIIEAPTLAATQPKRKRRAAEMQRAITANTESEDEDDVDHLLGAKITKTEEQSDEGDDPEPTTFVGLPTATDNEQPGPSGVGKSATDAPCKKQLVRQPGYASSAAAIKHEVSVSGSGSNKLICKCNICAEAFHTVSALQAHYVHSHSVIANNVKEEVIQEEINLTFSTDSEDDELELVFNDTHDTVAEEMKKMFSKTSANDIDDTICVLCDNGKVMKPEQLRRHYKKHEQILTHFNKQPKYDQSSNFYCHICKDDKVIAKKDLKEHYRIVHQVEITNNKTFFRKARSKRPRTTRPEVFRCEICSEEFPIKTLLDEHFDQHADQYSCDICDIGFKKLIDYTFHMQEHSEDKLFTCPLCEFSTDKGYLVKSHLYTVHDQFKKYKCELCGKGFAIFTHFQEHKYFHTGEKPFQCKECGQKFMYTRYLNSHTVQMHKKTPKDICCTICNKAYSHRNSLNTHMKSHKGLVSVCDVCGKTLSSNEKLRLHYRIHTGEKPYKCDYCQKSFKTSSYRAEHERIHTGEKPYECPFCGKGFSQRTSMVIHSRGHTGEKPYICHLCNKAFAAKSMVTIHLKSCRPEIAHFQEDEHN